MIVPSYCNASYRPTIIYKVTAVLLFNMPLSLTVPSISD